MITKKLPHPSREEFAIGAAAEDGSMYLTPSAGNIDEKHLKELFERQSLEIKSRIDRFRKGRPLPKMQNRIIIIADDGIATGSTIVPAIKFARVEGLQK